MRDLKTLMTERGCRMKECFISRASEMSRSANDNDRLEAELMNLPRIAQVVHDHPLDDNSKADNAVVRSYKPSRESIMMMHGELDSSNTHEAQKISSVSARSNNTSPTKTAPGASSCCFIL
jgi:hypothetical protein